MKKSYHSIVVPTVLAITARRNCARCSTTDSPSVALSAVVIAALLPQGSALCRRAAPHLSAKNDHWQPPLRPSFVRRTEVRYCSPGGVAGQSVRHHGRIWDGRG